MQYVTLDCSLWVLLHHESHERRLVQARCMTAPSRTHVSAMAADWLCGRCLAVRELGKEAQGDGLSVYLDQLDQVCTVEANEVCTVEAAGDDALGPLQHLLAHHTQQDGLDALQRQGVEADSTRSSSIKEHQVHNTCKPFANAFSAAAAPHAAAPARGEGDSEAQEDTAGGGVGVRYRALRLVEIDGMHLQVKLLVSMWRWKEAVDSIGQLRWSLRLLGLDAHAAVDDCFLCEALCLAGLGNLQEARLQLRRLQSSMLDRRLAGALTHLPLVSVPLDAGSDSRNSRAGAPAAASTWTCRGDRERFFRCVKAAGSLCELLQDFVGASAYYIECAQSWTLANDFVSTCHPFVAEASFATTRARWRAGLISDMPELLSALHTLCNALTVHHPIVSTAQLDVSEALMSQGRVDEAETLLLQAQESLNISCGLDHPHMARCLFRLACVYEKRGPAGRRYGQVITLMDGALAELLGASSKRHIALFPILAAYADVCSSRGASMLEHQVLLRRWALRVLKDTLGDDAVMVHAFRHQLVVCLQLNAKVDEARLELRDMLTSRETSHGPNHVILCDILVRLVDLEVAHGRSLLGHSRTQLCALEKTMREAVAHVQQPVPHMGVESGGESQEREREQLEIKVAVLEKVVMLCNPSAGGSTIIAAQASPYTCTTCLHPSTRSLIVCTQYHMSLCLSTCTFVSAPPRCMHALATRRARHSTTRSQSNMRVAMITKSSYEYDNEIIRRTRSV